MRVDLTPAIERVHSDTAEGFRMFYQLIHGQALPKHAQKWIEAVYKSRAEAKGIVIEAFRGSTKTTTMMTFVAYRIGLEPEKSHLIIQVGDDIAQNNAQQIADIIANNKFWKVCFPSVVPDTQFGWGAKGYEIVDTSYDSYESWRRKNADRKDPTLVGLGRTSRAIIGKHPTGCLIIDDIDDENTTSSDAERSKTNKILTGTIFPTMTPETWTVVIGTPWTPNDTLAYVKATGEFGHAFTPVYDENDELTWPEVFNDVAVQKARKLAGELEFARMFLLNLEAAKGRVLKREWLHEYPVESIGETWPVVIGVDYASTADKLRDKERDYFALAVGRLIPGGGVVVVDGVRAHLSQGEAEVTLRTWATNYPSLTLVAIEAIGKGEEFYHLILRNSRLPVIPAHTGRRSKGDRFQKQLAPLFQFSRAWISNAENEFLTVFKDEWASWPLSEHDDTLDAVYYMTVAATQAGNLAPPGEMTSEDRLARAWYAPKKRTASPWAGDLGYGRR